MTLGSALQRALRLPPHVLAQKIVGRVQRYLDDRRARRDLRLPTYAAASPAYDADLPCCFSLPLQAALEKEADGIHMLAEHYMHHRFDLLGSGWVEVAHGVACRGVEGVHYPPGPVVKADTAGAWLIGRINAANLHAAPVVAAGRSRLSTDRLAPRFQIGLALVRGHAVVGHHLWRQCGS